MDDLSHIKGSHGVPKATDLWPEANQFLILGMPLCISENFNGATKGDAVEILSAYF